MTPTRDAMGHRLWKSAHWNTKAPLFMRLIDVAGGTRPGSLPLVPAALQPQRTRLLGDLHSRRDARDPGVRRPGRHQRLHLHPLHGHALHTHRQQVSIHVTNYVEKHSLHMSFIYYPNTMFCSFAVENSIWASQDPTSKEPRGIDCYTGIQHAKRNRSID